MCFDLAGIFVVLFLGLGLLFAFGLFFFFLRLGEKIKRGYRKYKKKYVSVLSISHKKTAETQLCSAITFSLECPESKNRLPQTFNLI